MQDSPPTFAARSACTHCGAPFTPLVAGQTVCDKCQGLAHPEPVSPLQHVEVAGYKLIHELGAGRFSHSWLAEDPRGAGVVLKLLRRYAPDPNSVQRFLSEAQRLAELSDLDHPNLARPVTAGVHLVSAFFLVYASGGEQTLADELRQRGRVLPGRALEFCAQVCEGLAVMHGAGLLHLDLKPANVGITRTEDGSEQVVVLDLATSHLLNHAGIEDGAPLPLSSAAYFSPEQAAGKPATIASDLYAVGVLLFQLVSGRLPMMGGSADDLLRAHRESNPLRLRDVGRKVHDDLESMLSRLLAKDPAHRPHSGDEAAVLMRSIIPVADIAPMDDGPDSIDDPVLIVEGPRPEPEIAPPPQMLPPAVDPALERALLGEVPPQPPEKRPGIPHWAARVRPRWWPYAASGLVLVLVTAGVMLASRPSPKPAPVLRVVESSPVMPPRAPPPAPVVPSVVDEAVKPPGDPIQDPTTVGKPAAEAAPAPVEPVHPPAAVARRSPPPPSPYAKNFERAQKALWTGQPAGAETILQELLRKSLTRHDKARATKMMGDAQVKKGNKSAAATWYRKSLKLYEDPDDREKVSKLLAGLR